jgi:putative transposase
MRKKDEQSAVFWCGLLHPVLFGEVDASQTNQYLKRCAQKEVMFPDGRVAKPSLSTLKRKLKRYRQDGFEALARRARSDRGAPRSVAREALQYAAQLKRDQPLRSHKNINRFIQRRFGVAIAKSTLYRHLRAVGATRLKLGVVQTPVRKRWTREHTHDLWVGDFEDGPYVLVEGEATPSYLSGFIDCHSRYVVEARYYLRENLDILIDSLMRGFAVHGAPRQLYVDNAKVYHAKALKAACYRLHIELLHRPAGDPSAGGLIEKFFQTAQGGFEAEVRQGDILELHQLNRAFSAWLELDYHQAVHSATGQTPKARYASGLGIIRQVDLALAREAFMQSEQRKVHRDFADVQLHRRFYRVDPKLRGDKVEVRYDPFGQLDVVHIHSLDGTFLCEGRLHAREQGQACEPNNDAGRTKHNYLDLLVGEHDRQLVKQQCGIDYRAATRQRPWPFIECVRCFARLMGRKGELSAFNAGELETIRKVYDQDAALDSRRVEKAFAKTKDKSVRAIAYELRSKNKETS